MGAQKSKENDTVSLKLDIAAVSHDNRSRRCMAQDYLLIWVDAAIDESNEDCQKILTQLRNIVNDVKIFTESNQCIRFLKNINENTFIIASGSLGQYLIPEIHDIVQLDTIHIFCSNKSLHDLWARQWSKIRGVHTQIETIYQELQLAVRQCNQDAANMSFIVVNKDKSGKDQDHLEPSFMYTQIFKEILLEMKYNEKPIKDFVLYFREFYTGEAKELNIIKDFEVNYKSESAIKWYTRECFVYGMLNRALRTLDVEIIIIMCFFIHDLHCQIEQLHKQQMSNYHGKPFVTYRGQGSVKNDFDQLLKSKNGLISFNNFLSTSEDREKSMSFAKKSMKNTGMVGVLFTITIDPSLSSTPFPSIDKVSYFPNEKEILFSMHTVFRICRITETYDNHLLHQVDLKVTADNDEHLCRLTQRIREEISGETGWERLGQLLLKLNEFDKAEELYMSLLKETSDRIEIGIFYNQLGYINKNRGDLDKAMNYYTKALEIYEKTVPLDNLSLATCYTNIGTVYDKMEFHSKALMFYKRGLTIKEKTLPSNHHSLGNSYNNIAGIYDKIGEYSKAISFYKKDLKIREKTLPPNHPDLATSYNNIGMVYLNMKQFSKALSFFERALNIFQRSLPSTHPSIKKVQTSIEFVRKKQLSNHRNSNNRNLLIL